MAAGAAILAAISGCTSLPGIPDGGRPEIAWQGLNAADMAQTVTIAREPREYSEAGMGTVDIIGRHPTERGVEGFFLATSVLHYAVSSWLAREADATGERGWYWAFYGWEAATIINSAYAVAHNVQGGVALFGPSDPTSDGYFPYCTPTSQGPCAVRGAP